MPCWKIPGRAVRLPRRGAWTRRRRDYRRRGADNQYCEGRGWTRRYKECRRSSRLFSRRNLKQPLLHRPTCKMRLQRAREPGGNELYSTRQPSTSGQTKLQAPYYPVNRLLRLYARSARLALGLLLGCATAFTSAHGQDPSIDRLLKKLPPPEKLVKPSVQRAIRKTDAALGDPLVTQIFSALDNNNYPRALDLGRKLTAAHSNSGVAHCLHGLVAILAHQLGEASQALHQSAKLQPSLSLTHLGLAAVEVMQQCYAASIPHLQRLTQLEPSYLFGWLALSDSCLRAGRKQEAAEAARKAAAIAPSSADAWLQLARTEREVGHMEAALRALSRGAEVSPDSASILATVGFGYINLNRLREAIPPLERAARIAPRDFLIHAQLGFCLQATGQVDAGIKHLRTAASLAPKNYAPVWEHLGLAYQRKGMHADAAKAFERAVQIMPSFGQAWGHLAEEYRALGRTADANNAESHARSSPRPKSGPKRKA
jgi:tetratricopeptide (TPR) repeat protein